MNQPTKQTNVLARLRWLVPKRPLSYRECERIAELQANRLRELSGIDRARLPGEAISDLPRLNVRVEFNMPVSGLTYWDRGLWTIAINGEEPHGRRRFSLAHELKHVLDHTHRHWLFNQPSAQSRRDAAEHLADYFAGCLLMPKRWVKSLFGRRLGVEEMARSFGVTVRAMNVRLSQLGLTEPTPRCDWPGISRKTDYHRASSEAA